MSLNKIIEFQNYRKKDYCYFGINNKLYKYDYNEDKFIEKKNPDKFRAVADIKQIEGMSEEESMRKYIKDFDEIAKLVNKKFSKISLNYDHVKLNKALIYLNNSDHEQEDLDEFENDNCSKFSDYIKYVDLEKETNETTTTYDINSFHPYLFSFGGLRFAYKSGNKKKITNEEFKNMSMFKNPAYFLIECNDKPFYLKNTIRSRVYWVTNYDIQTYKLLDLKYNIYEGSDYNCYLYDESYENSKSTIATFKKIYEMKKNKNTVAKIITSRYVGLMFQKERQYVKKSKYDKESQVVGMEMDEDGNWVEVVEKNGAVEVEESKKVNCYNISRNQRFFYSFLNYTLVRLVKDVIKNNINIYRIYCDSITCDKNEHLDKLLSDDLGKFKIENKKFNNKKGKFMNLVLFQETDIKK